MFRKNTACPIHGSKGTPSIETIMGKDTQLLTCCDCSHVGWQLIFQPKQHDENNDNNVEIT